MQSDGCHLANAGHAAQFRQRRVQDAAQAAEALEQCLGGLLHVRAGNGQREQQFQRFVLREPPQPVLHEAFAKPLAMAVVVRRWHVRCSVVRVVLLDFHTLRPFAPKAAIPRAPNILAKRRRRLRHISASRPLARSYPALARQQENMLRVPSEEAAPRREEGR